jgi:hypothetical protein
MTVRNQRRFDMGNAIVIMFACLGALALYILLAG